MSRSSGASVVIVNGALTAFLRRKNPSLRVFLPDSEPERTQAAGALARKLAEVAVARQTLKEGLLISEINDQPAETHLLARFLEESGFVRTAHGFQMRRSRRTSQDITETGEESETA